MNPSIISTITIFALTTFTHLSSSSGIQQRTWYKYDPFDAHYPAIGAPAVAPVYGAQAYIAPWQQMNDFPWPVIKPMPIDMTNCLRRLPRYLIESCQLEAHRNWEYNQFEGPALSSGTSKRYCCSTWDIVWCVLYHVRQQCTDYQYMLAKNYFYDIGDKVPGCFDYSFESFRCRFPWWAILLIVLGGLVVIAAVGYLTVKLLKKKVLG